MHLGEMRTVQSFQIVGERQGMIPEFLEEVRKMAGFELKWMDGTKGSIEEQGGSWSGCMYDVGVGNLDICVQGMYATPERSKLTLFTIPYAHDRAYMAIPKPKFDKSLMKKMTKVFEPFRSLGHVFRDSSHRWYVVLFDRPASGAQTA
jgi:hypothetical protein